MDTSIWTYGMALGLAVDAGLALALALSGRGLDVRNLGQYAWVAGWVAVLCWQGLPVAVAAFRGAVGVYVAWYEWRHPDAPLDDTPPAPKPEPEVNPYPARWAAYWRKLAEAGAAYGWTQAALTTEGSRTKVMSEPAWNTTIPHLVAAGWLTGGKPGRATRWASGKGLVAFVEAEAWKTLPCPDYNPPEIANPPYTATLQQRNNDATAEKRVIDGVRAD